MRGPNNPERKHGGRQDTSERTTLPPVDRLYPVAKSIHMIRGGRDVAVSSRRVGLEDILEDVADKWMESLEQIKRFCGDRDGSRFLEVNYEFLVDSPGSQLKRVTDFRDRQYDDGMLFDWKRWMNW